MSKKTRSYDVGYGKPPKHGQFKPGQSGNPKGKPKSSKNLKSILEAELDSKLEIIVNGKKMKVTKQQAFVKSLTAKAVQGDTKAATLLLGTILKILPMENPTENFDELTAADEAIIADFEAQIISKAKKDGKLK